MKKNTVAKALFYVSKKQFPLKRYNLLLYTFTSGLSLANSSGELRAKKKKSIPNKPPSSCDLLLKILVLKLSFLFFVTLVVVVLFIMEVFIVGYFLPPVE